MKRLTAIVITLALAAASHADKRWDAASELMSTMDWEAISADLIAKIRPRDVDAESFAGRLREAATREVSHIMSSDELARLNREGASIGHLPAEAREKVTEALNRAIIDVLSQQSRSSETQGGYVIKRDEPGR